MPLKLTALFLFIFNIFFTELRGQLVIKFDSTGLLRQAPKERIRAGRAVQLQIPVTRYLTDSQASFVVTRFFYLNQVLNEKPTDERMAAEGEIFSIYLFFQNANQTVRGCVKWNQFLDSACMGPHDLKTETFSRAANFRFIPFPYREIVIALGGSQVNENCGAPCLCEDARNKMAKLRTAFQKLEDIVQREGLIRRLLCNRPERFTIFDLGNLPVSPKTTRKELVGGFVLKRTDIRPNQFRFGNSYIINKDTFSLSSKNKDTFYFKNISPGRKSRYLKAPVYYVNEFDRTVLDWHNKQQALLDRNYVKELFEMVMKDTASVKSLQEAYYDCRNCNEQGRSLADLKTLLVKYDTVWCEADPVGKWLINWLWFSGGDLRLNYLKFTSPDNLISESDLEKETALLANLEEKKQRIVAIKKAQGPSVLTLDTLNRVQDSLRIVEQEISRINKKKDDRAKNETLLKKFSTVKFAFHSLQVPLFNSENKRLVLYHDVNDEFERVISKKAVYPDDRTVYYGFYNSKEKDTTGVLSIKEEITKFNDTGEFIQNLIAATSGLQAATALINPYALPISGFLKTLKPGAPRPPLTGRQESNANPTLDECDRLRREIRPRLWRYNLLKAMLLDYKKLSIPGKLSPQQDDGSGFNTYTVKATQSDAPFTNTYSVTYKQKAVSTERFSVGRQKLIAFGAGFFYSTRASRQVRVDTSANNFLITTTDTRTKFVVGVKLFPWRLFEPDGGIIPRYPMKRVSVFLGFEATKPLENLYGGLGWDLVPGLQVSAGAHIYRNDSYTLLNNRITDKSSNYKVSGWYYGVTLDPVALTGLLKSFFQ